MTIVNWTLLPGGAAKYFRSRSRGYLDVLAGHSIDPAFQDRIPAKPIMKFRPSLDGYAENMRDQPCSERYGDLSIDRELNDLLQKFIQASIIWFGNADAFTFLLFSSRWHGLDPEKAPSHLAQANERDGQ
jgi:hypothetical protein